MLSATKVPLGTQCLDSPAHSLSLFHPTRSYSRYTLAYQDAVPTSSRSIEAEDNDGDAAGNELVNLREINSAWTALHNSFNGASTYDVMQPGEKNRLARDLWSEEPLDVAMRQLRADNAPLVELLQAQMSNTSPETEHSVMATQRRIDGILLDVCRGQNKFHIPLVSRAMLGLPRRSQWGRA